MEYGVTMVPCRSGVAVTIEGEGDWLRGCVIFLPCLPRGIDETIDVLVSCVPTSDA